MQKPISLRVFIRVIPGGSIFFSPLLLCSREDVSCQFQTAIHACLRTDTLAHDGEIISLFSNKLSVIWEFQLFLLLLFLLYV